MQPPPVDPDPTLQWLSAALLLLPVLMVGVLAVAVFFLAVRPWLKALLSGAPVSLIHILGMRLRGSPVPLLIDAHIALQQRQQPHSIADLERAYLAHPGQIMTVQDLFAVLEKSK